MSNIDKLELNTRLYRTLLSAEIDSIEMNLWDSDLLDFLVCCRGSAEWTDCRITDKSDDMSEMLKNTDTLADILKKPVPNRDIEDFE